MIRKVVCGSVFGCIKVPRKFLVLGQNFLKKKCLAHVISFGAFKFFVLAVMITVVMIIKKLN